MSKILTYIKDAFEDQLKWAGCYEQEDAENFKKETWNRRRLTLAILRNISIYVIKKGNTFAQYKGNKYIMVNDESKAKLFTSVIDAQQEANAYFEGAKVEKIL